MEREKEKSVGRVKELGRMAEGLRKNLREMETDLRKGGCEFQ